MILVTGGTGLVGSHLLVRLVQENEPIKATYRTLESIEKTKKVFSYYTNTTKDLFTKIEWIQADITDVPSMTPAFKDVKKVYHCAAVISFDPADYRTMRKVNIHGTAIIANLAIDAKVQKLCFVSSIATIGDDPKIELANEENDWGGNEKNNGYAITKYGAETEVWRASQEGVDVVIVNPGVILGSGFWTTGSGKMFSQIDKEFSYYSNGVTGFVGVKDVVGCMVQLMQSNCKNQRFILVSENKSFKEVLFSIAEALGKKKPTRCVQPWQASLFWRWEWLVSKITSRKIRMSKYTAKTLFRKTYYSSEKCKIQLEVTFKSVEEVIKQVSKEYLV
ncbi:NAD-dependent epimerase/dehydratase family protein [Flavobacteriaceae bacterium]|jgi:nucleoside-diphosphate-sugar epimerase|nr:NAD-dependent epimerase/dehydratase family protein [Flavobacteriaceae bacterium]